MLSVVCSYFFFLHVASSLAMTALCEVDRASSPPGQPGKTPSSATRPSLANGAAYASEASLIPGL
jgi:hypothetical protein